jgi:CRP-like cAMP-binding protein
MSVDVFNEFQLFKGLTPEQFAQVQPLFALLDCEAGDVLFEQGGQAEFLYLLVEGEVDILYKPEDGPELTIARVRPEGVVGWSAALGSPAYTSSAVCVSECQMLRARGEGLRSLYEHNPETGKLIIERLAALIAERLRNTHEQVLALLEQSVRIGTNGRNEGLRAQGGLT